MVGFSTNATVTFVPFFASAPETPPSDSGRPGSAKPGSAASAEQPPGPTRFTPEADRPETDRVVALQVAHALAALNVPILRTLEVSVHDGHVTLRGRVRTYYERQLANAHAKRTPGVKTVRGEITVAG